MSLVTGTSGGDQAVLLSSGLFDFLVPSFLRHLLTGILLYRIVPDFLFVCLFSVLLMSAWNLDVRLIV